MIKRLISIAVIALVMLWGVMANSDTNIRIKVNGSNVKFVDQQPVVEGGTTLVPIRFIAENLGFDVGWNNDTRQVTVSENGTSIVLTVGSDTAKVNGKEMKLAVTVKIIGDRTMVPLRFISENMNCTVDWFRTNNIAAINKKVDGRAIRMVDRFEQSEEYTKKEIPMNGSIMYELIPKDPELHYFIRGSIPWNKNGTKILVSDGEIIVKHPYAKTRAAVKDAIGVMSPANKELIYMYYILCARGEVYESFGNGDMYPSVQDYLDGRNVDVSDDVIHFTLEGKRFPPFGSGYPPTSKLQGPIHDSKRIAVIETYGLTEYTAEDYKKVREQAFFDYFLQYFTENIEYYELRGVRCFDPRKDTNAEQEYRDAVSSYPVIVN